MSEVRVQCILVGHLTCVGTVFCKKIYASYLSCAVVVFDLCEIFIVPVTVFPCLPITLSFLVTVFDSVNYSLSQLQFLHARQLLD